MSPELKKAWTDALRSEAYQQGQEYLACNGRYCCLGVLCDVLVNNPDLCPAFTVDPIYVDGDEEGSAQSFEFVGPANRDGEHEILPTFVNRVLGLDRPANPEAPIFKAVVEELNPQTNPAQSANLHDALTTLNDEGASFAQIANIIDEQLQ